MSQLAISFKDRTQKPWVWFEVKVQIWDAERISYNVQWFYVEGRKERDAFKRAQRFAANYFKISRRRIWNHEIIRLEGEPA